LNLRLVQRPIVDAQLVDNPVKIKTTSAASNVHIYRGIQLRRRNRAGQDTVIANSIHIDVQGPRRSVVDASHVIPHIQRTNGRAIALSTCIDSTGNSNPKGMRPGVWTRLELPSGGVVSFGNDLSIIPRVGRSLHPGTPSHTSADLQQGRITQINVTGRSIEIQRIPILASGSPGSSLNGASYAMTGGVSYCRPAPLVEAVSRDQAGSGRWCWRSCWCCRRSRSCCR
jgi:hypothetical protein